MILIWSENTTDEGQEYNPGDLSARAAEIMTVRSGIVASDRVTPDGIYLASVS